MTANHVDVLKPREYGEHRKDSLAQCLESSDGRVQDLAQHLSQALREVQALRDAEATREAALRDAVLRSQMGLRNASPLIQDGPFAGAPNRFGQLIDKGRLRQLDAMWAAFEKGAIGDEESYWPGNAKEAVDSCR